MDLDQWECSTLISSRVEDDAGDDGGGGGGEVEAWESGRVGETINININIILFLPLGWLAGADEILQGLSVYVWYISCLAC